MNLLMCDNLLSFEELYVIKCCKDILNTVCRTCWMNEHIQEFYANSVKKCMKKMIETKAKCMLIDTLIGEIDEMDEDLE